MKIGSMRAHLVVEEIRSFNGEKKLEKIKKISAFLKYFKAFNLDKL